MTVLTMFDGKDVVLVLLREDLTVLHWLHGGMIVVLVDFTIDGGGGLLVTGFDDSLVDDSGCHFLVNGGVMVTSLVPGEHRLSASGWYYSRGA